MQYNDHQYIEAARLIEENPKVQSLGLCNFDTQHMDEIIDSGVNVVSNQVQVSLYIFISGVWVQIWLICASFLS